MPKKYKSSGSKSISIRPVESVGTKKFDSTSTGSSFFKHGIFRMLKFDEARLKGAVKFETDTSLEKYYQLREHFQVVLLERDKLKTENEKLKFSKRRNYRRDREMRSLFSSIEEKKNIEISVFREKYDKLYNRFLKIVSERDKLQEENEKLKSLTFRSYEEIKLEQEYEISRATIEKDSLLILMELRESTYLKYEDLASRTTLPKKLFLRLAELTTINYISVNEGTGEFTLTTKGLEFMKNRGL